MKNRIFKFGIIAIALLGFMAFSPGKYIHFGHTPPAQPVDQCSVNNTTFTAGEEIVYKIYYNWNFVWLDAGEVTFKVEDAGDQYYLSAKGKTYPSYEWFFKVEDHYEAYVNKDDLLPTLSIRNVREGKYRLYDKIEYDQDQGNLVSLRGKTKSEAKSTEYTIDKCMHDALSMIYFIRNFDYDNYSEGQELPMTIFMDKKTWPLGMTYLGREKSKRIKGKGKFNTIKVSPEVIAGNIFDEDTRMEIWVSDDKNRIPLLIKSPVSVGSIKAVIIDYKGLRHDLDASLKKKKK